MLFRWQNDRNEPLVLPDQRLTIDCCVMEPQKLGPYELQNRLGRGGMGAVYEARHEQTGETVAVKLLAAHLTDDPGLRQRFEAEIETLKPLRSSGIVHLLAFGEQDGQPYFAMELVRGKSLSDRLKSVGPLPWRQAATLASDIVRALKVAHDHGIIHRDLKPANLLLVDDPQAAGTSIKLADFGIARLFGSAGHTAHGSIVGTAEFMAPEQAAGKPLDARADLYALGLVMFTMLTGKPPFRGAQLTKIITQQLHEKPPSISQICPDVPAAGRWPPADCYSQRCRCRQPGDAGTSACRFPNLTERRPGCHSSAGSTLDSNGCQSQKRADAPANWWRHRLGRRNSGCD
ncbi:MAG: serine/threonine protein kinase [Planctomycetia bacterium]|nr:serine/threonine protein kinase [Planctomycetia bacterium]